MVRSINSEHLDDLPEAARAFLDGSEKAAAQWSHEGALAEFETLDWLD